MTASGSAALLESATARPRHLINIEERGIDLVEPCGEARQPAVEDLGRHVAARVKTAAFLRPSR